MESQRMPDYAAEAFYQHLIPSSVFEGLEKPEKEPDHCIVFCKKNASNVFDIRKGVAIMNGSGTRFNDGTCMIVPETKVVIVFEQD